ncbi:hypothetical protein [Asanoa ishikariensis]|uniref:aromatic-ring hydroxylase C-terminal domain-containing protein n=1 Tax=Asanoa ishikariensis TaxID=137265 RepID=UPI00314006C5
MAAHRTGAAPTARPSEGLVLGYHYTSAAVIADSSPAPPGDPVADYEPVGRPGHRLPHLWLGQPQRTSTLDLLDPLELTVLAGRDADWCPAWPVTRRIGTADLPDPDDAFLDLCGIGPNGAVLVRPDGHIAWRAPARPADGADALVDAAGRILSATPSARPTSPARNVPPGGNRDHPADDRI